LNNPVVDLVKCLADDTYIRTSKIGRPRDVALVLKFPLTMKTSALIGLDLAWFLGCRRAQQLLLSPVQTRQNKNPKRNKNYKHDVHIESVELWGKR
jgi:hypothetical protein